MLKSKIFTYKTTCTVEKRRKIFHVLKKLSAISSMMQLTAYERHAHRSRSVEHKLISFAMVEARKG